MPLASKAGDAALSLSLRGNLAVFVAVQRQFEEAREIYAGLLEQTRSQGIWPEYMINLANLANLDSHVGDYAGAERQYRLAWALARRYGKPSDSANVLDKLGIVCAYQDRPDDARRYMEMARDEARRGGDRRQYGRILGNLSNVATSRDDCLRLLWESREISLELGNPWGLAATCINLAERLPADDPRVDNLLNEAEQAARTTSAESYLGIIACSRALRGFNQHGQQATRESWLKGLAQVRNAQAPGDEQSVLSHMREFCAARGIAEFVQTPKPG
jgi:tetratricopeptide (TPR) repeat protein